MSRPGPLVYATRAAERQAARLLSPGTMLEAAVSRAIESGAVSAGREGGIVFLDDAVAHCERRPGRIRPRPRAWLVTRVEPRQTTGAAGSGEPAPSRSHSRQR